MRLCKVLVTGVATAALIATASCSSSEKLPAAAQGSANAHLSLKLAVASPGLPFLQLYVADKKGFYAKRNLSVTFVSVDGSAAATAALQSGGADATVSLPEGAITAIGAGAPLKMIGTTVNKNLYSMYGSKGVNSLNDLAGKKIAILTEGNGTELQARRLLDEKGAGAAKSTYVATGGLPNRLAALQQGQVAGTLLFPPFDLNADKAGLTKLYDFRNLGVDYPNEVITVGSKSLTDNREALKAFMDSLREASSFIAGNLDEAVTIGADVTGSPVEQVRLSLSDMKDAFSADLSISTESLQSVLDVMRKYSTLKKLPSIQDIYVDDFNR
jgi:NitT/TauT family transport system substrate-binding protein